MWRALWVLAVCAGLGCESGAGTGGGDAAAELPGGGDPDATADLPGDGDGGGAVADPGGPDAAVDAGGDDADGGGGPELPDVVTTEGALTFDDFGLEGFDVGVDGQGMVHVVWAAREGDPQEVVIRYGRCAGGCRSGEGWEVLTLGSAGRFGGDPRFALGPDGRVHTTWVFDDLDQTPGFYYATCAGGCTDPTAWGWTSLPVPSFYGPPIGTRSLAVDAAGRPAFVVMTRSTRASVVYYHCTGDCTDEAGWESGEVRTGANRIALAFSGTTAHMAVSVGDERQVYHRFCATDCTDAASWTEGASFVQALPFSATPPMPVALAATAQGRVVLAYNQGQSGHADPDVAKQDDRLLLWECTGACELPESWRGVIVGEPRLGQTGLSVALSAGGRVAVAGTTDIELFTRVCDGAACITPEGAWSEQLADSSDAIALDFDPYISFGCTDSQGSGFFRPSFAAWYPYGARVALGPGGALHVVHSPYILRNCAVGTGIARLPGFGRYLEP